MAISPADSTYKKGVDSFVVKADTIKTKFGDSIITRIDTVRRVDTISLKDDDTDIKDKITYKAKDSIVYDIESKKMFLYNGAETHYEKIQLNADAVEFDWTTMVMTAQGAKDSAGNMSGKPIFKEDGKEYRASKMMYNFKKK